MAQRFSLKMAGLLCFLTLVILGGWVGTGSAFIIARGSTGGDVTAPEVSTATIGTNGTTLTLGMSETVTRTGGTFDVDCSTAGSNLTATYSSGSGSNSLVYTIGTTVNSGDTCDLDYDGAANGIEDGSGNDLAAITSQAVTNNSTQGGGISGNYGNTTETDTDSTYGTDPGMTLRSITIDGTGTDPTIHIRTYYALDDADYRMVAVIYDDSGNRLWYGSPFQDTTNASPFIETYTFATSSLTLPAGTYWVGFLSAISTYPRMEMSAYTGGTTRIFNATAAPWNSGVPPATMPTPTSTETWNTIVWLEF